MLVHVKRKVTAGALIAATAVSSLVGVAPAGAVAPATSGAVTVAASGAGVASESGRQVGEHRFRYIKQDQGQENQWSDCGPASILMALLHHGGTLPDSYSDDSQAAAMTELRNSAPTGGKNRHNYLMTSDVKSILTERGVQGKSYVRDDATKAIEEIKGGKTAIVLTQTGVIPDEKGAPGYGHFVYVSDYDAARGTFTVNDPLKKSERAHQATEKEMEGIITQAAQGNIPWAYVI
ncbi:C39 family peptidase [Corynebacterium lowii]|uniref:Peptidase C39-like domain-containing protein n=1 Tax=Corynebacterium lowii TaxID=1544413 RepID=A0A0Q1AJS5_9CORY|nr:C39 family peptidase [Corynebacterium lowii]KQB87124.1 hypothetical protein Clow_00172 [Corynebacterium lowii]MDP9852290.1 hypothetical protein [Corynebacterium lowii]